jgi:hypoxanthine phosphoribosyltransferase
VDPRTRWKISGAPEHSHRTRNLLTAIMAIPGRSPFDREDSDHPTLQPSAPAGVRAGRPDARDPDSSGPPERACARAWPPDHRDVPRHHAAPREHSISIPHHIDFLQLSSYDGGTKSTGTVRLLSDLAADIGGRDVLIVEDIVDTGLTLQYLRKQLEIRQPRSLRVCALLNKVEARQVDVHIDFVGFDIPNQFVVGYGLDYEEKYRNLPYIGVLDMK